MKCFAFARYVTDKDNYGNTHFIPSFYHTDQMNDVDKGESPSQTPSTSFHQSQQQHKTSDFGVRADVQHLIETYAPTTIRVEKKVNWNRSRYKCYDASGNCLGRVKGKLGDRYWVDRAGYKHY